MGSATTETPAILIIILILIVHSAPAMAANRTAYEVLQDYNFPVGILPLGVTGYDLNVMTGEFSVYLASTCSFSRNHFHLKYNPTVKGVIWNGKISGLNGIYEKRFLVWMEIAEIARNEDDLVISVGSLSSAFPIFEFLQSPPCDDGGRVEIN